MKGTTPPPVFKFVDLKQQQKRHDDLLKRLKQAELDRDQAEKDFLKEKNRAKKMEKKLLKLINS